MIILSYSVIFAYNFKFMKKFFILFLLNVIATSIVFSQDEGFYSGEEANTAKKEKKDGENKWIFGGQLGMQFGSITYIDIAPTAMYKVTPRFLAGPGLIYVYENYKDYNYESSTYGFRAVATYALFSNLEESINLNLGDIILQVENEVVNIDRFYYDAYYNMQSEDRDWIDNLLVGAGIYQRFGNRGGGISILLVYDVTQNYYSSYPNRPFIKLGFFL
jgi:hypothetical protein